MQTKADSRRRTPEGEVVLVKTRSTSLLVRLRETKPRETPHRLRTVGWTTREVAAAIEISVGHYADIENGHKQPSYAVAKRLADFHGEPVEALFEEIPLEFGAPEGS